MSRVAQAEGRSDDARRAVKKALRKDPRSIRAWDTLGDLEAERSRSKQALVAWLKVIELETQSGPLVFKKLEATYAALGKPREFEQTLRDLMKRNPDDVAPVVALAETLAARGESELAIEELRAIIDRFPDSIEARCILGRVLLSDDRANDAAAAAALGELLDALGRRSHVSPHETLE
jgi:lipopolysaccharide biosynthesis regulator YciM